MGVAMGVAEGRGHARGRRVAVLPPGGAEAALPPPLHSRFPKFPSGKLIKNKKRLVGYYRKAREGLLGRSYKE